MKNIEVSRITIDIPKGVHKKFKALAAATGRSMKEMVVEYINDQVEFCSLSHEPNNETIKAIDNIEKKQNLTEVDNLKELFKDLGI